MKKAKTAQPAIPKRETSNIRWTDEDWKLIGTLQESIGVRSISEIVRMGLRSLARERAAK